ncbi:hypothetical protein Tco_1185542 [Tanacetum coccineum]
MRAKAFALSEGESSMQDHHGLLRSYAMAIEDSNVGSTVKVGLIVNHDEKTYFDRFHACLNGLKEGWKLGCRKIIALDGYLPTRYGLTLISDKHKGLIEVVNEVMPYEEHRQCARHTYEGFLRNLVNESSEPYFGQHQKHHILNWLTRSWKRLKSECFNAVLVIVRHKHIITMLESMRVLVMERMNTMRLIMEKWTSEICPKIQSILEYTKDQQSLEEPSGVLIYFVMRTISRYGEEERKRDTTIYTGSGRGFSPSVRPVANPKIRYYISIILMVDYKPYYN